MPDAPMLFHGLSALPMTPADRDGRVEADALARLVQLIAEAMQALDADAP